MEIERKFLLKDSSWKKDIIKTNVITQGYICTNPEHTVRVRIIDQNAWITFKGKNKGISRVEIEHEFPLNKAYELLNNFCQNTIISKARHIVMFENHKWEIDEFYGRHLGLVIAEIELKTENEKFELPPWIGEDVSNKKEYFNSNLAASSTN